MRRHHQRGERPRSPRPALVGERAEQRIAYCRISTSGSEVAGIRSQVVASLSEKRQLPPRPLRRSPSLSSLQVESPMSATEASQPGLTPILEFSPTSAALDNARLR